jgi:hypothetical protein
MSSLWTPEGEHPVGSPSRPASPPPNAPPSAQPGPPPPPPAGRRPGSPDEEAQEVDLDALKQQLAATPVDVVVANHAFGLFELAALHLSLQPPQLEEARLAIDAVAALVESLGTRLGDAEPTLREGLAQLRLAFVQIKAMAEAGPSPERPPPERPPPESPPPESPPPEGPPAGNLPTDGQ